MRFPRMLVVRQHLPSHKIADIPAEVAAQLHAAGFSQTVEVGLDLV